MQVIKKNIYPFDKEVALRWCVINIPPCNDHEETLMYVDDNLIIIEQWLDINDEDRYRLIMFGTGFIVVTGYYKLLK